MADLAFDVAREPGGLFSCNMVIWQKVPERQLAFHVSITRIARLLGSHNTAAWQAIVDNAGRLVAEVFNNLDPVPSE